MPEGDRLHHKMAVVDDRWTLMGSHNWSSAAETQNDEFILLIDSPAIAKKFKEEILLRFKNAYWGVPSWLPSSIEEKNKQCAEGNPKQNDENDGHEKNTIKIIQNHIYGHVVELFSPTI